MQKNYLRLIFSLSLIASGLFVLSGCESLKTRSDIAKSQNSKIPPALRPEYQKPESVKQETKTQVELPPVVQPPATEPAPVGPPVVTATTPTEGSAKVGVIFGPGGMRAFAHIGVIRELIKNKIPIHSVAGIELGALVGGIFSVKAQMYDVEWQMMKLREDHFFRKGLMSTSEPQDLAEISEFLKKELPGLKIEDTKIPFACPSYNLSKKQGYMISRGAFNTTLPFCLPYIPMFQPYGHSIAGLTSAAAAAKFLRSKGANYIIYVDVLNESSGSLFESLDSPENLAWSVVSESLEAQLPTFNKVIRPQLNGFYLTDFSKRRDLIQKGQDAAKASTKEILSDLGM